MEEKSKKKAKEVKMDTQSKPTYEELEKAVQNLNMQCQQFYQRALRAEQVLNDINEVGVLLSIIEKSEYFDDDFISKCVNRIQTNISELLEPVENNAN